ncbi:MAG: amidohydrolase [Candidatus Latescibacterota bacterium]
MNGKIVTADPAMPEASAVAVRADTIAAVGPEDEIRQLIGPSTLTIDLAGNLAIPGFIEGHGHFMSLGQSKMILDLTSAESWDDIVGMVDKAVDVAEPGEWITGRGWHQEKWNSVPEDAVDGVPTHHSLSQVSPDNPVYLRHASGHASFANAEAMRRSAISAETPNPPGGEIIKDVRGEPTGHLRETAQQLVARAMSQDLSQRTDEEILAEKYRMAELAANELLENGITAFHDAGASFETIDFYKRLVDEGRMPVRLYVMVSPGDLAEMASRLDDYRMINYGDKLTVRSIKQYIDGALGAHGAWLLEPYEDMPSTSGLNTVPIDSIKRTAEIAVDHDFQLNTHAIGDRANREVLDIYEAAFDDDVEADRRWRIEHAQHIDPADIDRFAELGVIASMQAVHATSDGPWVPKRIGEERAREGAYIWQSLWKSGALVTNGTDVPVEDVDPIANFYSSVSRRLDDGTVFYPDQRLTREQALKAYTTNNAYASFEENRLGSISVGKWADITVVSRDIMTVPEEDIPGTRILYTIVGGKVEFDAAASQEGGGD